MIPLADLKAEYLSIKSEIDSAIADSITQATFIKGRPVQDFEKTFAEYLNVKHCITCGNGTDALEVILAALNIGRGDEVLVPSLTWISTAEAVNNVGAEPVFVEVNPRNYTIDYRKAEEKITNRTKAIIAVHLYGCPSDLIELKDITEKNGMYLIEDCAQSHGAEYDGKKTGTFGIASGFSFFPSKNLGAYGDAGAVVTDNEEIADKVRMISNHGQLGVKHKHYIIGRNSRLDTIQAAILNIKLKYLDDWNLKRQRAADIYLTQLKFKKEFILPSAPLNKKHVYHLFVLRCKNRTKLIRLLDEKGIAWGIHYPSPLPFVNAYEYKKHTVKEFILSQKITQEIISIPIFPQMTPEQQNIICEQLLKYED